MKTILVIILAACVLVLIVLEVGLQFFYGFGNPLIYIPDEQIGYLLAPNQLTKRFGNRILVNQYGMRSYEIEKTVVPGTLRVLLLGDSIANGGWWTDQENTISSLMMRSLSTLSSEFSHIEVLNASANSWGPRNELAYIERFGTFDARIIVLLINTDDLFAISPTSLPVGRDRNYPDTKPPAALVEVWQRYFTKPKLIPELTALGQEKGDRVGKNLEAISKIHSIARANNAQFLLAMTPLLRETDEKGPRDYEIQARQRLSEFTKAEQITYIDFLPAINSHANPKTLYQDHIHFNLKGNQLINEHIVKVIAN